jgi:hypothetical protein
MKTSIIDPVIRAPFLSTIFQSNIIDLIMTQQTVLNLGNNKYKLNLLEIRIDWRINPFRHYTNLQAIFSFSFSTQSLLNHGPDSITSSSATITTNRGDAGIFRIVFSLKVGNSSNTVESFIYNTNNSKPLLLRYTAPDTLIRPTTGIELLFLMLL